MLDPRGESGRTYSNKPPTHPEGKYIKYDVNSPGVNGRDKQRFVRNQETGDVYYTQDHYNTFLKIGE